MVSYTIYDEAPHLEIGDVIHGYSTVRAPKYRIIIYSYNWGNFGNHI